MIDLQINGYVGVDFNDPQLDAESFHRACQRLWQDGVKTCLPTIITNEVDQMAQCLRNIATYRARDPVVQQVVGGVHIEGPFLNEQPGYIGAHPPQHARAADIEIMRRLIDASDGLTRLVTLAPERDASARVTRFLSDQGIVVAAGHTDASLDELRCTIDAGLRMFTHLGNGCPQTMHRHDNIIQRALSMSERLWISLIADGAHVPWFALGNYLARIGWDHAVVVSDAISAAGLGPGTFSLAGRAVHVGEDLVPRAPDNSHFIGAATTLGLAADNLRGQGYSEEHVAALTQINPRRILDGEAPARQLA